jgi:hypothetical protein
MELFNKKKVKLLLLFYKSNLTLNISLSTIIAGFSFLHPLYMLFGFGVCFMSAGSLFSLLYKEISKQKEYYFYYNNSISKKTLYLICIIGNFIVGFIIITIFNYAKRP